MHNQIEFVAQRLRLPSTGTGAVVLNLDNVFFQGKTNLQKTPHNQERKRHVMFTFSGIPDENRTVFIRFEDSKKLGSDFFNLIAEPRQTAYIR